MTLPDTMRAVRLLEWGRPPELVELPVPVPGPGELLLRVEAAGLCHSDLHVLDAEPGALPYELPFTLGHEIAGSVAATGPGVDPSWRGAPVVVHGVWSCGECRNCARGRDNYCLRLTGPVGAGLGRDGGLADFVLVPDARHLVRSDGLPPVSAAPLTDAGLTAVHAVRTHGDVARDGTAVVIGAGGLGHLALQLLRHEYAAWTVAVDTRQVALDLAEAAGADATTDRMDTVPALLLGAGCGPGADLVLDFVGAPSTMDAVPALLAPGGRAVVVGSAGGVIEAAKGRSLARGWTIAAPFWGPRADLERVVGLARSGVLAVEHEALPLDEAMDAYARLRAGQVRGRAVVVP